MGGCGNKKSTTLYPFITITDTNDSKDDNEKQYSLPIGK
jgi:hypothetical protein